MAILLRCKNCKNEMKISAKKCHHCGSYVPAKGKIYKVIVRHNGLKKTKTVDSLELAREVEGKFKVDVARDELGLQKKKPAPTLNQIWDKYSPWAKENKKSWKTDKYYYEKHLQPVFGDKRLDAISPFDIEKLIASMKKTKRVIKKKEGQEIKKPYALATIKHQVVLLTRLYSVAEKWGLYSGDNPCRKVKKPKLNNQKTGFLSDDELIRLFDTLDKWPNKMSAGFVSFLLYTGLRRGELFKLTWSDIDMNRETVTLKNPKGQIDQTLPLSKKAIEVLKNIPKEFNTPWVFYGKDGGQRKEFKGAWLRIKKAAKLPEDFRLHDLRHHFASALVSAGKDLYTVQKLLCHKDASTTQRYAHLADKTLRDAVNLSDDLLTVKKADVIEFKGAGHEG